MKNKLWRIFVSVDDMNLTKVDKSDFNGRKMTLERG